MLKTRFSEKELTKICELMREHGTNCATIVEILKIAYNAYPNDAMSTFRHVRLLKEFGIIEDNTLLCNVCDSEVIENHANTCTEYKDKIKKEYFFPCPDEHYDYSGCYPSVWMTDFWKVHNLTKEENYDDRDNILKETFPDMPSDILYNHPHFLCEKHVGSMKPYSNKITGYR